jgi:hypothetical protein
LKLILIILSLVTYSTCSKDALKGNKLYRVIVVEREGNGGEVRFRRYRDEKTVVYECLPDSVVEGKLMMLPAYE